MTEKKHILVMSSWYPTRVDPYSGNFVERFARLLSNDYQVTVLFTRSENRNDIEVFEENDAFRTVIVYHPEGKSAFGKFKTQRKVAKTGFEQIREHVDLIFAHVSWPKGLQFAAAKKHFKAPLLLLEHGSYFRPENTMDFFQKTVIRKSLKAADSVAAVSDVLRQDMLKTVPQLAILVIPNPVDTDIFQPAKTEVKQQLLHISTLDPKTKHPEKLLHALRILKDRSVSVSLKIVSDQSYAHLEKLAQELGIQELLSFDGPFSEREISNSINASSALIQCSSYETFGIVIAEAWMCGTPVISTSVGIAANLNAEAGIQVEGTPESISDGIQLFLKTENRFDPKKISDFGRQFSTSNLLHLLHEHIRKLTEKN